MNQSINMRYQMFSNGIFVETMVPIKRIQDLAERIVPLESDFALVG